MRMCGGRLDGRGNRFPKPGKCTAICDAVDGSSTGTQVPRSPMGDLIPRRAVCAAYVSLWHIAAQRLKRRMSAAGES
jgi:hypothetical protein